MSNVAFMQTPTQCIAQHGRGTVPATATTPERPETDDEALTRHAAAGRCVLLSAVDAKDPREYARAKAEHDRLHVPLVVVRAPRVAETEAGAFVVIPREDAKNLQKVLAAKAAAAKAGVSTRIEDE